MKLGPFIFNTLIRMNLRFEFLSALILFNIDIFEMEWNRIRPILRIEFNFVDNPFIAWFSFCFCVPLNERGNKWILKPSDDIKWY